MEIGNSEMLNALEESMVDCSREPPRGGGCFPGNEAIRDEATYHMLDHPYCKMCSKAAA
jgi:hypothetical protein